MCVSVCERDEIEIYHKEEEYEAGLAKKQRTGGRAGDTALTAGRKWPSQSNAVLVYSVNAQKIMA